MLTTSATTVTKKPQTATKTDQVSKRIKKALPEGKAFLDSVHIGYYILDTIIFSLHKKSRI